MLIQVCLLSETELATLGRAYIGALLSVDSQMIKKVVPLLKMLHALIALKDFDVALTLRIFVAEYFVSLS